MVHAEQPPKRRKASLLNILGEILVTLGVVLLLFVFYESYWTNLNAAKEQKTAQDQLTAEWKNPREQHRPALGEAMARMYIPAFGSDFQFAIVQGTGDADLLKGPGHYLDSQEPGQAGNFAVAGHRVGKGAPFNDLGNLQTCDAVVVETATHWFVYRMMPTAQDATRGEQATACFSPEQVARMTTGDYAAVTGRQIVQPSNYAVVLPLPGDAERADPAGLEPLMTMTTCHPQFSNKERMIIHAMLVRADEKQPGYTPPELEGK